MSLNKKELEYVRVEVFEFYLVSLSMRKVCLVWLVLLFCIREVLAVSMDISRDVCFVRVRRYGGIEDN